MYIYIGGGGRGNNQKCRYLARVAKAYRAEGLNFEHLAIQNEPNQGRKSWDPETKRYVKEYPEMYWTGIYLRDFLRDYLGPAFKREGISDEVGIFLSTIPLNDFNGWFVIAMVGLSLYLLINHPVERF